LLRDLAAVLREGLGHDIPTSVQFVPGNHDRLVNVYPALRDEVRRILGLPAIPAAGRRAPDGGWWFPVELRDPTYGVAARHGHQWDAWNFSQRGDLSWDAHVRPSVGEVFVTEFAVRLPWLLSTLSERRPEATGRLVAGLRDMHDVRPATQVAAWLTEHIAAADDWAQRRLDEAVAEALRALSEVEFLHSARGPGRQWDLIRRAMGRRRLRQVTTRAVDLVPATRLLAFALRRAAAAAGAEVHLARAALEEPERIPDPRLRFVVHGHTHVPGQWPLPASDGRELLYVNSGSWCGRIQRGLGRGGSPTFTRLRHSSFAVLFSGGEDLDGKHPGSLSFRLQTGIGLKDRAPPASHSLAGARVASASRGSRPG
jgi:hypothetical protein